MNDFEQVLDDCLDAMGRGASTLDECLAHYPEYAAQLRPLLQIASRVERGRAVKPSSVFKARTRARLTRHANAQPGQKRGLIPFWRMAVGFAALVIAFLVTGTAYAQSALPGDALYNWKLTSERAWRVISADPIGIDLALADRRLKEYVIVSGNPALGERALKGYQEALGRLHSDLNDQTEGRIRPVLEAHQQSLKDSGLTVPELKDYLVPEEESILQPVPTVGPMPGPTLQLPPPAP